MTSPLSDGLNANVLHRGKQDKEWAGHPPVMKLNYKYSHPFSAIAKAYLTKYNWESRTQLTTIAHVDQVDDDTIVYWRRCERYSAPQAGWEKVTINRKDNTMKCDTMMLNTDKTESIIDSHKFWADGAHTKNELSVFAGMAKSYKVETFKYGIS